MSSKLLLRRLNSESRNAALRDNHSKKEEYPFTYKGYHSDMRNWFQKTGTPQHINIDDYNKELERILNYTLSSESKSRLECHYNPNKTKQFQPIYKGTCISPYAVKMYKKYFNQYTDFIIKSTSPVEILAELRAATKLPDDKLVYYLPQHIRKYLLNLSFDEYDRELGSVNTYADLYKNCELLTKKYENTLVRVLYESSNLNDHVYNTSIPNIHKYGFLISTLNHATAFYIDTKLKILYYFDSHGSDGKSMEEMNCLKVYINRYPKYTRYSNESTYQIEGGLCSIYSLYFIDHMCSDTKTFDEKVEYFIFVDLDPIYMDSWFSKYINPSYRLEMSDKHKDFWHDKEPMLNYYLNDYGNDELFQKIYKSKRNLIKKTFKKKNLPFPLHQTGRTEDIYIYDAKNKTQSAAHSGGKNKKKIKQSAGK